MILARRLIIAAGSVANPRAPTDPQVALVEGVVGIRFEPAAVNYTDGPLEPPADLWDVLVQPDFDASSLVRLYEAELYEDGTISVKRDFFGKADCPHTWAGWPVPGDAPEATPDAPVAPTSVLTKAEQKALALVRKYRDAKKG